MTPSDDGRRGGLPHAVRVAAVILGTLALSALLDPWVARTVANRPFEYSYDLFTMFRLAGYLPLWAIVSVAFVLIDSRPGWRFAWQRGAPLLAAVSLSGLVSEVLKILVRRERPDLEAMGYVFRPWQQEAFATSGLGWPSGHIAVAMAAACALSRLHPRAAPVWALLAAGCAFSRLARNDHFLSDVVAGALVGYAVVAGLWPLARRLPRS